MGYPNTIVKYNDIDSQSLFVVPSNSIDAPNNGTIVVTTGAVDRQIFVVVDPLYSVTNHPLLAPKSPVLRHLSSKTALVANLLLLKKFSPKIK